MPNPADPKSEPKTDHLDSYVRGLKAVVSPFRETLNDIVRRTREIQGGAVAGYIPELAKVDPALFGVCVVSVDGQTYEAGDSKQTFTIQSASKPFVYGMALEDNGRETTLSKVGVEPTGDAFNSLIKLDATNRPHNPMVNAGAIATTDLVKGEDAPDRLNRMLDKFRKLAGRELGVDMAVFTSEKSTGHRNRAISHLMLNFGMVSGRIEETLDLYFKQCSILVNCRDLAVMAATLANNGINPLTKERALDERYVRDVVSVISTCGMYDYSGEWMYRVGIPAKSGVSGCIFGVIQGVMGIAAWSPPVDARGNSVRSIKVFEDLSDKYKLHAYEPHRAASNPFAGRNESS